MTSIITHKHDRISFELLEYEKNNNYVDFLSIRVNVSANGFSGFSEFWVDKTSIINFIEELESFHKDLKGSPKLTCGWDDIIYFEMSFILIDSLGHIGLSINIANPVAGLQYILNNSKQSMNRLFVTIELEANEIEKFIIVLRSLLDSSDIDI